MILWALSWGKCDLQSKMSCFWKSRETVINYIAPAGEFKGGEFTGIVNDDGFFNSP